MKIKTEDKERLTVKTTSGKYFIDIIWQSQDITEQSIRLYPEEAIRVAKALLQLSRTVLNHQDKGE